MSRKLSLRQMKFVERFLATNNATQSYIAAGYKGRGHTAEVEASKLLRNPEVKEILNAAQSSAAAKVNVTAENVIQNMKKLATYRGKGWSHMAAVRATEILGRMFGLFPDKQQHEHMGKDGKPIEHNDHALTDRIDHLTDAFLGAARREEASVVPGDCSGKPMDS